MTMYAILRAFEENSYSDNCVEFAVLSFTEKTIAEWDSCAKRMAALIEIDGYANAPACMKWEDSSVEFFRVQGAGLPDAIYDLLYDEEVVFLDESELQKFLPVTAEDMKGGRDWQLSSCVMSEIKRLIVRRANMSFDAYIKDGGVRIYTQQFGFEQFVAEMQNHTPVDPSLFDEETIKAVG